MFWLGEGKTPWSHDYVGSTHYPMKIPKHLLFRFPSFFLLLTVFLQPQFRSRADYTATWNARNRGADKFELFSNSPMWWMCYNHNPSGADSGSSDNLQSWNYDQHAIYLATIAKYCRDNWGITFNSIEAFNEPVANWW